jgi:hypothetical protein
VSIIVIGSTIGNSTGWVYQFNWLADCAGMVGTAAGAVGAAQSADGAHGADQSVVFDQALVSGGPPCGKGVLAACAHFVGG